MRLLVCGGRAYADRWTLWHVLDLWHNNRGIHTLIHGGARGADRLAAAWAHSRQVPCLAYLPDWSLGDAAGPQRNALMLKDGRPDIVLAFPGGTGTADMMRRARAAGVRVVEPVQARLPGLFMRPVS